MLLGVRARSSDLASALASERPPILWRLPSEQNLAEGVSSVSLDG